MWRLKAQIKNDGTRQAKVVNDSYSSKTTPFKYAAIHIVFYFASLGNVSCKREANMNYYIAASARPAIYELLMLEYHDKTSFSSAMLPA